MMLIGQEWWRRVVGAAALGGALAVAACGGGGGSGGGAALSVGLDARAWITAEVRQDTSMPAVSLVGSLVGDPAALAGKTLYIVVEDPAQLFEANPFITYRSSTSIAINLIGRVLAVPGLRQGQMRVFACLDPACATQLSGSPMAVPYRLDVLPGLTLATPTLSVNSTFGNPEIQRTVTLGLPRDTLSFAAVAQTSGVLVASAVVNGSNGDVTLRIPPAVPGRHAETVRVVAVTADLAGQPGFTYEKIITIDHLVADDPAVNVVFSPAETVSNRAQGDILGKEEHYIAVLRPGATLELLGVDYLSAPPAAAAHVQVNAWWLVTMQTTTTCFNTISSSDCLPAGTYTARDRYRLTVDGIASEVTHPITLNIAP